MEEKIIKAVLDHKLIAIIRSVESDRCMRVAQALYDGGIRMMEITYDQRRPETWEETAKTIGAVAQALSGKVFVGAGTVTCPELVDLTHKYGGQFIISPDVNEAVIRRTRELGLVSMPGAMTPTEVMTAYRAGAHFVKLFPAGELGLGYLKAIRAPISHVPILAVGGIDETNVAQYIAAGAAGAGIGGKLVNRAWVENGEYDKITNVAKSLVAAIQEG